MHESFMKRLIQQDEVDKVGKSEVDKLNIDKLKNVPSNLRNL